MSDLPLASTADGGIRLPVRVMPRSPRTVIDGVRDGRLIIRVTAPPVDDAANDAVVGALASALGLPRHAITIAAGATARNKTIEILGATASQIRALGDAPRPT
jgi:uncharacterized protein YggU (UPF0235/DUF167 family)